MKDYLKILIETPNNRNQEINVDLGYSNMIEPLLRDVANTFKKINPNSGITKSGKG